MGFIDEDMKTSEVYEDIYYILCIICSQKNKKMVYNCFLGFDVSLRSLSPPEPPERAQSRYK